MNVILEKLIVAHLVEIFLAIFRALKFSALFTELATYEYPLLNKVNPTNILEI
jgi:hypothetical protein